MPLAREHLLEHYYEASRQNGHSGDISTTVEGVVYVETDVRYEIPSNDLSSWAKGPLDEIYFLRTIVEGQYGQRDSQMLLAIVAWAPMDQPTPIFEEWLHLAEKTAGPETWTRIKGFRFLLQAISDQAQFESLVFSKDFIDNLKILGRRGFSFDVGVDQHSGGIWQLEAMAKAMHLAHQNVTGEEEKVVFVLNHLCKPEFRTDGEYFSRWREAIAQMSKCKRAYMKLSGAFSELADGLTSTQSISACIKPWVEHVFGCFRAKRTMFGSDWPVCNVKGPRGENSWAAWRDVVKDIVEDEEFGLSDGDKERVWRGTVQEAYGIT